MAQALPFLQAAAAVAGTASAINQMTGGGGGGIPSLPPMPDKVPPPISPTQAEQQATQQLGSITPTAMSKANYLDIAATRGFGPGSAGIRATAAPANLDSRLLEDVLSRIYWGG